MRDRLGSRVTVIGVGGIERGEHARDLLRAGANLVQLYTGFVYGGPSSARAIAGDLASLAAAGGLSG